MLVEVNIKNFAIIEDLKVGFTKGLNIITGETGTGKSILIEAIGMILGSRTNKDFIQTGFTRAVLEGVFFIEDLHSIKSILEEYSIDLDEDNLLIITKEIQLNGPSLSKVNGKNLTLSMLKNLTKELVDIYGQHEHQSLLDPTKHIILVDSFGDKEFKDLKLKIQAEYYNLINEKKKLKHLSLDSKERDREIDILNFQIKEIDDARLTMEDEDDIDLEYKKLSNINEISISVEESLLHLSHEEYNNCNAVDLLNKCISLISNAAKYDQDLSDLQKRFENLSYELQDLNRNLIDYLSNIEMNSDRLNFLIERLNLVNRLKKKYGNSVLKILEFKEDAISRLKALENYDNEILALNNRIATIQNNLNDFSSNLSNKRKKIAKMIEIKIREELITLNMINVNFKVEFDKTIEFTEDGFDKIEFLISTNPGESLKSLSRIVSGGEMSRIMLAFKSILAFFDEIPTMIFDEIDSGISGRTAQIVGEKIDYISSNHQVICISHLPQIAAFADSHFLIDKTISKDRTSTTITKLNKNERINEMARLVGGVDLTSTAIKHAKEMIEMATKNKI